MGAEPPIDSHSFHSARWVDCRVLRVIGTAGWTVPRVKPFRFAVRLIFSSNSKHSDNNDEQPNKKPIENKGEKEPMAALGAAMGWEYGLVQP